MVPFPKSERQERTDGRHRDDTRAPEEAVSPFTDDELAYLSDGLKLARLATVGADGTPHVVPVGWSVLDSGAIEIRGHDLAATKKFRDVARTPRAAVVIDDLASTDPWRPRGIEVRGAAEAVSEPRPAIRIRPERIVSWGVDRRGRYARSPESPG
jgi:pyridoxamine 5'-phosphate oxidase family protein